MSHALSCVPRVRCCAGRRRRAHDTCTPAGAGHRARDRTHFRFAARVRPPDVPRRFHSGPEGEGGPLGADGADGGEQRHRASHVRGTRRRTVSDRRPYRRGDGQGNRRSGLPGPPRHASDVHQPLPGGGAAARIPGGGLHPEPGSAPGPSHHHAPQRKRRTTGTRDDSAGHLPRSSLRPCAGRNR